MILWWAVLAVAGVAAAIWLAGGALASWREQRAGLVYELTPRYLGAALRGGAALLALGGVLTGSLALALDPGHGSPAAASADARPPAHPPAATPAAPGTARGPSPAPVTPVTPATPVPTPATGLAVTGHPYGGELLQGVLPGFPGRVQVWLPKQYRGRAVPLQAVLVFARAADLGDVFGGLSGAVDAGRANAMVAVVPEATCSPAGTVDPAFTGDALRRAVAARFHVAPAPGGWSVLGLDVGAPCAVAAELARPASFRAAAGLGGRYAALPDPAAPSSAPGSAAAGTVRLLLAEAQRDGTGVRSSAALGATLTRLPHTEVRLSSAVRDFTAELERFRLVRVAAGYFAEQFAASAR